MQVNSKNIQQEKNRLQKMITSTCRIFLLLIFTVVIGVFIGFLKSLAILGIFTSLRICWIYNKNLNSELQSIEHDNPKIKNLLSNLDRFSHSNKVAKTNCIILLPIVIFVLALIN